MDLIGFAEQEPVLICDSIRYNLGLGDFSDTTNIEQVIKPYTNILNMADFLSMNTLDYKINDSNTNLSGGERQKLAIYKEAFILSIRHHQIAYHRTEFLQSHDGNIRLG